MAYAQSGTEEAAGFAQSLANAVNSGNTEAITNLANTVGKVKEAREQAASEVALWQVDFNGKMDEIVQKAETAITDMNLSTEADAAARATMQSYASQILSEGAKAVTNAKSIADQVKAALNVNATVNVGTTGSSPTGYASGTDFATPGWHLVGEEGPEIVEFSGGETVYNADETDRMLSSVRPTPLNTNVPESLTGQHTETVTTHDKKITLVLSLFG